jgi:hypothetical protein
MPTLRVELPARVSQAEVEALRGDLAPYGYVDELPPASYDPAAIMLGISFVSDVLQGAEVLTNWFQRSPPGQGAMLPTMLGRERAVGWAEIRRAKTRR